MQICGSPPCATRANLLSYLHAPHRVNLPSRQVILSVGILVLRERHAEFRITSARRRRLPTCMHAFRYRCPCAIRRFSRRCRFAHGCSARCALNHSGGSASKRCLMTIRTFRSLRWVSLTTGGNTHSGSSCLLNVGVCGHHNLHADADAALRTASNRVSGVTTRFVAPTVRILRLNVVNAKGYCGNLQSGDPVASVRPSRGYRTSCRS